MPPSTEQKPALRPTDAEKDSKGEFLGLEGRLALFPLGTLFAGLMIFSALYSFKGAPIFPTALLCLVPGVIVGVVVIKFVNKKPPGHLFDAIDTYRGRAAAEYQPSRVTHPLAHD